MSKKLISAVLCLCMLMSCVVISGGALDAENNEQIIDEEIVEKIVETPAEVTPETTGETVVTQFPGETAGDENPVTPAETVIIPAAPLYTGVLAEGDVRFYWSPVADENDFRSVTVAAGQTIAVSVAEIPAEGWYRLVNDGFAASLEGYLCVPADKVIPDGQTAPEPTEQPVEQPAPTPVPEKKEGLFVFDYENNIGVYADGAIPENTKLNATPVDVAELGEARAFMDESVPAPAEGRREYYAYDISFLTEQGVEVEPDGEVTVTLEGLPANARISVLHIKEKPETVEEIEEEPEELIEEQVEEQPEEAVEEQIDEPVENVPEEPVMAFAAAPRKAFAAAPALSAASIQSVEADAPAVPEETDTDETEPEEEKPGFFKAVADFFGVGEKDEEIEDAAPAVEYDYVRIPVYNNNGVVTFVTDSFSEFLFTVDFYYDGYKYSIPGESEILLSELFALLNIDRDAANAVNVEFSDETLVAVEQLEDGSDWKLISLLPFETNQKLTITFADGEVLEIQVTDANKSGSQGAITISSNTTWTLTGNLTVNGQIYIDNGATLTINTNGAGNWSIIRGSAFLDPMICIGNGSLIINGQADHHIIVDGKKLTVGNSTTESTHLIANQSPSGNLTLQYVDFKDTTVKYSNGGAISNLGTCSINHCTFNNCNSKKLNTSDTTHGNAGAIANFGTMTVSNSKFTNCSADNSGGAIMNDRIGIYSGRLTLTNCTIGTSGNPNKANLGAGIFTRGDSLTINGGTKIQYNQATTNGGGVYYSSDSGTSVYVNGSVTVQNNTANGNPNNVYLPTTSQYLKVNGDLTGGYIGIYTGAGTGTVKVAEATATTTTISGNQKRIPSTGEAVLFHDDRGGRHLHLDATTGKNNLYLCGCLNILKYNANGGSGAPAQQSTSTESSLKVSTTVPKRTGYTFKGWNTKSDGTGKDYAANANVSFSDRGERTDSTITLSALWAINTSTLKVDPNGGVWNGSNAVQSFTQNYNTTKAIPVPTRTGYTFAGWERSGDNNGTMSTTGAAAATYTFGAANSKTDTIKAKWTKNNYTVSGTIDEGSVSNSTQSVAYKDNSKEMVFTPTPGYTITGVKVNGTPVSFTLENDGSYKYPSFSVEEDKTVEVTTTENTAIIKYFVAIGGGTVTDPSNNNVPAREGHEDVKVATGTAAGSTAAPNPGYKFVGWYSDPECTQKLSDDFKYDPPKSTIYETATYYAKFEKILGDLTIKKSGAQGIDENQSFIFHVASTQLDNANQDPVAMDVVITGNGSVTIKDLPVGKYTVTEDGGWSWRYTAGAQNVTVTKDGASVTISNTRDKDKWLSGCAVAVNTETGIKN